MNEAFALAERPNWHGAAESLVAGLATLESPGERMQLLESVCRSLGDRLYPAFLQVLHVVDECADVPARQLVASTLVDCLVSGRLPAGKLSAWGSSGPTGDSAFGQTRTLGPLEYVCAWYSHTGSGAALGRAQFATILTNLVSLINADERARTLYLQQLEHQIEDPLGGSLSNRTRAALRILHDAWSAGEPATALIDVFLGALQEESSLQTIARWEHE